MQEAGVPPMRFEFTSFCTFIFDRVTDKVTDKVTENQKLILFEIEKENTITTIKLAEIVGISQRKVKANIAELKKKGLLIRHGKPKDGYWQVMNGDTMS